MSRTWTTLCTWPLLLTACAPSEGTEAAGGVETASGVEAPYARVVDELGDFIRHEMEDKELPGLSIALVDGQQTVWSAGFGRQSLDGNRPATPETVYRVGSVSKLFTDIGVMQMVEEGRLDLDAPVGGYLSDVPSGSPLASATLRQLTSHRAGLVREPPVGHYFDDTGPSLAETVRSFATTRRVYPPEARIKYSNAGIATVGYVLQTVADRPFAEHLRAAVLEPLGMERSSFERAPRVEADLADALMWSYHGVSTPAPTFALGMAPAGSMYSTVDDLALFLRELFRIHGGATDGVVSPETLAAMWTPQFSDGDGFRGYGIGFSLSELEGHGRVGHGGAIYGFATTLQALPDEGLGVVAVTNVDVANVVVERVAETALRMMLAAREGEALPEPVVTGPVDPARALELDGRYRAGGQEVRLIERNGGLLMRRSGGGVTSRLRGLAGDTLVADDRISFGPRVVVAEGGIELGGTLLEPVDDPRPDPVPAEWAEVVGEYGWDHNILYVLERDGELRALIEWFFEYPLTRVADDVWEFGESGLYPGERLTFLRDAEGRVEGVSLEGLVFPRRAVGADEGETFRIDPVRPVEELRAEARAATPPVEEGDFLEPDLVELVTLDPTIHLDIRYASTNNFMNARFYEEARAFLQRPAAEGVVRAHRALEPMGYGILVHDGYRPWSVTKMFYDATPEDQKVFVADPADGSRHNRGAAVDLTLFDRATGEPVRMTGGYDEFSDRSYPGYPGGTSLQRWHRELLRDAMEAEGFTVYEAEWWHFDFGEWRRYPILNFAFDEIGGPSTGGEGPSLGGEGPSGGREGPSSTSVIDGDRLWRDLGVLAHDSMQGRRVGTEGAARARAYIARQLGAMGLEPVQDTFPVERGEESRTGVNVRAVVPGTEHPDRYLALTAHYDHLGVRDGAIYNGTDDNASGTAGVLALARWLVEHPPLHSVVVALLDAEEGGLEGARHLVAHFPVPLDRVLLNLNLDMVSRSDGELWVSGTHQSPALRPLVEAAEPVAPVFLRFGHDTPEYTGADNWVNASDHAAFHREGVPFLYFGVADHPGYHQPSDDIEHIDRAFYEAAVTTVARVFDVVDGRLEGARPGT